MLEGLMSFSAAYRSRRSSTCALVCAGWVVLLAAGCAGTSGPTPGTLSITNVTLYDCGLAQLERQGRVSGRQRFTIPSARAHLDDMLATLVMRSDGKVKVTSIRYPSVRNRAQAWAASSLGKSLQGENEAPSVPGGMADTLSAMVGTHVEVKLTRGKALTGVVLTVGPGTTQPSPAAQEGQQPLPQADLSVVLVTDDGEMVAVPLADIRQIRPSSHREAMALKDLATSFGPGGGFTGTELMLDTSEGSSGTLALGYIQQSPVWRMAYRLVGQVDKVRLEAWAVAHNDSEEDWSDVSMTLLSGLPSSYVLSLASPRYVHRDFLHLQDGAEMQPQLGADSPDDLLYESGYGVLGTRSYTTAAMMSYGASGSAGYGMGGGSSHVAYGRAAGVGGAEQKVSSLLDVGDEVDVPEVAADVEREVATYTALNPVSIPAGSSGLVPLIRRDLPGRMATVIGRDGGSQTCAFVENDTGLVLQPGVASVYVEGRYRGQLEVFRTQPGQKDTWCFGEDPDVSHSHTIRVTSTPKLVTWENSKLWLHTITTESTTFDVVNDAGQARSIAVEVVLPHKARLVEPTDALHGDGQLRYALLEVPARTTSQRLVVVERGLATAVAVGSASIKALMDTPELPTEYVGHLRPAYDLTLRREAVLAEIQAVQALLAEQQDRSNRVKENLRAVPAGSSGLSAVQRMLEDLASTEREIRRLEDLVKGKTKHVETLNKDIELALTPLTPKEGLR